MRFKVAVIFTVCMNIIFCASPQKKTQKTPRSNSRYHYNMGSSYLQYGQFDKAIEHFKQAITINPRYYLAHNALGLTFSLKGEMEEAIQHYEKCLEINPKFGEAYNNLGAVYQEMGLLDEAEQKYLNALSDKTSQSRENAYYNLARLYVGQNKLEEALLNIDKALDLNRRMHMAFNLKGVILEKKGDFDLAIEYYKQAVRFTPKKQGKKLTMDGINYAFNLAVANFKFNKLSEAKEIFEKIHPEISDPEKRNEIDQYLTLIKEKKQKK